MKKVLSILMLTTGLCGVASADDKLQAQRLPDTPAVNYITKKVGASLAYVKTEDVIPGGLPGYISDRNGHRTMIYLLPNSNYFFVGSIIDSNGVNITLKSANEEEAKLTAALQQLKDRASTSAMGFESQPINSSAPQSESELSNPLPVSNTPSKGVVVSPPVDNASSVEKENVVPANINTSVDVSSQYINSKIDQNELLQDIKNTAYFQEYAHSENDPIVYFVVDPKCPFCHMAWDMLSQLMQKHNFSINVILSNALPGSDGLVTQLLANPEIVDLWNKGVGSKDNVEIPSVVKIGSQPWVMADKYRMKNNAFAEKYRALTTNGSTNGVPIIMYVGKDGKVRAEQGVYTGKDRLDAMKAFLSGLPGWKAI